MIGVQLKRHIFWQLESFRGLVDIPRMCLLYVNFGWDVRFEHYKPTKKQIMAIAAIDYTAYNITSRFSVTHKGTALSF